MGLKFNPFTATFDYTPSSTSEVPEGTNLYYTDTRVKSIVSSSTSHQILHVMQDVGDNATADGSFLKPYKTIQAAITAGEAISAFSKQVIIRVSPSTGNGYVENLTFSQQGIILEAQPFLWRSDACIIRGNIVINLTGTSGGANYSATGNFVYIKGFILTATSGTTIAFSGSTYQRLFITDSYVDNSGTGSACVLTNTGASGGTKSTITSRDVDWNNSNSTNATMLVSAGRIFIDGPNPAIANGNASGASIKIDGASAAGPTLTADKTSIQGQVQITDNTATVIFTFCGINSGSAAAISTPSSPSTGYVYVASVGLTTTATNSVIGSGIIVLGGMAKLSTGGDIISTVTQSMINAFPQGATLIGATSTQVTNGLLAIKNGHLVIQQTTAPTSALQTGAGTTGARTLTRCTDHAGHLSITPGGTGIAAGAQLIVTFNKAYNAAPVVVLTPTNANATLIAPYLTSSTTTFTLNFGTAGTAATAYTFDYMVLET